MKPDSQPQVQGALSPIPVVALMQPGKYVRDERTWRGEVGLERVKVVSKGQSAKMERIDARMMELWKDVVGLGECARRLWNCQR